MTDSQEQRIVELEKRVEFLEEAMEKVSELLANPGTHDHEAWLQRARARSGVLRRVKE